MLQEEADKWDCGQCGNQTPDGTLRCRVCRHFRPLDSYPNLLHNPSMVTVQEVRELEERRQIELDMISKLDDHTGPHGVWYIINADWITEWKSFIFNK